MGISTHEPTNAIGGQYHPRQVKPSFQDTIAAIATPLGEGGMGVIRVSGDQALGIVQAFFRPTREINLQDALTHTCYFGKVIADASPQPSPSGRGRVLESGEAEIVDQVVVTVFRAPHSYTGEEVVEISGHGSPFTLQKILKLCLAKGARLAEPGEFTERAFLNGKMDLTQAEAVADLIRAKTDKTQAAAVAQMQGRLAEEVRTLRNGIMPLVAHLEVGLDHSDEDHDFLSRDQIQSRCRAILEPMEHLLHSARLSKILRDGWRVALIGRVNVGKSSLLNALLKEDRAIVTELPGTTRDTLEESVNWDGIPVVLTDTAGFRQGTEDPVERLGMERSIRTLQAADLVIGLFDGSEDLLAEDHEVIRQAMMKPHIWAINKNDLPPRLTAKTLQSFNGNAPLVRFSAKTGEGLHGLVQEVIRMAISEKAAAGEAQWLLNTRHQAALERARQALLQAIEAAESNAFEECVALELQTALQALGEIVGETTTEELLDEVFRNFCVGK
jgi:tRNA modification GTPase